MFNGMCGVRVLLMLLAPFFLEVHKQSQHTRTIHAHFDIQQLRDEYNNLDHVFFCPENGHLVEQAIIQLINQSSAIYGALYVLNRKSIIDALIQVHKNGVLVELVFDQGALNAGSNHIFQLPFHGVPLYIYGAQSVKRFRPLMHHKFLIFKNAWFGKDVIAYGSMNITQSGLFKNKENFTFRDKPDLVQKYEDEFYAMKKDSQVFKLMKKQKQKHQKKRLQQESAIPACIEKQLRNGTLKRYIRFVK